MSCFLSIEKLAQIQRYFLLRAQFQLLFYPTKMEWIKTKEVKTIPSKAKWVHNTVFGQDWVQLFLFFIWFFSLFEAELHAEYPIKPLKTFTQNISLKFTKKKHCIQSNIKSNVLFFPSIYYLVRTDTKSRGMIDFQWFLLQSSISYK